MTKIYSKKAVIQKVGVLQSVVETGEGIPQLGALQLKTEGVVEIN